MNVHQTALQAPKGPIDQPDAVIDSLAEVTPVVVRAFGHAKGERVREVTQAFARHMHAFVREIGLTEEEYDYGVDFLNRIGKATNDHHNEGILFADSIGRYGMRDCSSMNFTMPSMRSTDSHVTPARMPSSLRRSLCGRTKNTMPCETHSMYS